MSREQVLRAAPGEVPGAGVRFGAPANGAGWHAPGGCESGRCRLLANDGHTAEPADEECGARPLFVVRPTPPATAFAESRSLPLRVRGYIPPWREAVGGLFGAVGRTLAALPQQLARIAGGFAAHVRASMQAAHGAGQRAVARAHALDFLLYAALAFGLSRVLIFAAGILGDTFLPTEEGHWVADPNSAFLSMWAKWDSQWYVQIARDGYWYQPLQQSNVAFFPLYPLTVRLLAPLTGGNLVLAGFLLSNFYLLCALIFLYQLAALELQDKAAAGRTVFYLAFFPTAFFLSAVYTESLFLCLSIATIYFARRQRWVLAAVTGLLAAATRNLGVLLWLLVLWEWLRNHGWRLARIHRRDTWRNLWQGVRADWVDLLIICAIPLGLLLYVAFLQVYFGRPTAFVEVQAAWGRQNIGPVAVVTRELAALRDFTINKSNLSRLLNLSAFLAVLGMVPFIWRRLGEGYALYVLVLLLVPASSALQSMIRYVLPMFPVFILLGAWGRFPAVDRSLLGTFALLLGVLTAIYVNWIFVA